MSAVIDAGERVDEVHIEGLVSVPAAQGKWNDFLKKNCS